LRGLHLTVVVGSQRLLDTASMTWSLAELDLSCLLREEGTVRKSLAVVNTSHFVQSVTDAYAVLAVHFEDLLYAVEI
jgi:hypothetical protein